MAPKGANTYQDTAVGGLKWGCGGVAEANLAEPNQRRSLKFRIARAAILRFLKPAAIRLLGFGLAIHAKCFVPFLLSSA